jgi:hypothetical protein
MPMTPDLIEKAKEGKYPNPRAPKIDRDEVIKAKPLKEGGMVLEIGLRPASKQEMKMAKEMKPQKKANGGMVARGTGAAIRGKESLLREYFRWRVQKIRLHIKQANGRYE